MHKPLPSAPKAKRTWPAEAALLVDELWYLKTNPDVAEAGLSAIDHYMSIGWAEGRNPSPFFDTEWYFARYPDVELSGLNPLKHFSEKGWKELRQPHPLFDVSFYLESNSDVFAANINPLIHYTTAGWKEKRAPHPLFDGAWYADQNGDVVGIDPLRHYLEIGAAQLRNPNPLFDAAWYVSQYPDAAGNPLAHYATHGLEKRLNPCPYFDGAFYLESNPDVRLAQINPLAHYLLRGAIEVRDPNPNFSTLAYRIANPDVASNRELPLLHFIQRKKNQDGKAASDQDGELIGAYEDFEEYSSGFIGNADTIAPNNKEPLESSWPDTLGVHVHLFYEDMATKFARYLENLPVPFDLYVSVAEGAQIGKVEAVFNRIPKVSKLIVQAFPNRGRDIGPWLFGFGKQMLNYELICHVHTKRSPHNKLKRDWCTQLLHHLFANKAHTANVLRLFKENKQLGLVFPIYHSSLKTQIGWGSNFQHCHNLASRLGFALDSNDLEPFPAGSFFFARSSALHSLLSSNLKPEDFPEEAGQIDGTIAHAVERLLSTIVRKNGYVWKQIRSSKPHTLSTSIMKAEDIEVPVGTNVQEVDARPTRWPEAKVCVFSCNAGGYDQPVDHANRICSADYILFSDRPVAAKSWEIRAAEYWDYRPVRVARFHKTNPHQLLASYDIAVWVDANVQICGDITKYINKVLASNAAFGVVSHPYRDCAYSESEILKKLNRDNPEVIDQQMAEYRQQGFPAKFGLTETNFLIMDLQRAETQKALDIWWSEIVKHSFRDQLSFDYACWKAGAKRVSLFEEGGSVRSNADFTYFKHGITAPPVNPAPHTQKAMAETLTKQAVNAAQIVICVHNALDDVQKCLESVAKHTEHFHKVLVIDDNSQQPTAEFLAAFSGKYSNIELKTLSGGAYGYCRAANEGLLGTDFGDAVVMLNSDTIVGPNWLEGLMRTANRVARFGVVGPMSNAASFQSLPDTKASPSQTAINTWPADISVEEANELCELWAKGFDAPIVPLVHGFCQLISRRLLRTIGGFDADLFPKGYGEENDLCLRGTHAGFRHLIDIRTFVYHEKSKSYTNPAVREELMKRGASALKRRHGERQVLDAIRTLETNPVLVSMRESAYKHLSKSFQ